MSRVRFGVDRLQSAPTLARGRRIGVLTNDAARSADDPEMHSRVGLQQAGVPIARLFSPEHGLQARAPDGSAVRDGVDPLTGLSVVSLYGERFAPPPDTLRDLDLLLVDLPDVGARFYTYAWSMTHTLDACAATGVPVLILDRPNPLGGRLADAEGPLLETSFTSFVGRHDIPIRHSLTLGELARLWQRERAPTLLLDVLTCEHWERAAQWPDTGLTWVPTSPAMPAFISALLYPGICLFEATNVGFDRFGAAPFQCIEAEWLNAAAIAAECRERAAAFGVDLEPDQHRLHLRPHDRRQVRPVALGVALLQAVARQHPAHFAWSTYPTAANPTGEHHLERLFGNASLRSAVDGKTTLTADALAPTGWERRVSDLLLYE